jgi:hypothetical protein
MPIETSSPESFERRGSFPPILCPSRLRLQPPTMQRQSRAVVSAPRPALAWLDQSTRHRYPCDRFPGGVSMWGPSRQGGVGQKPVDNLTLRAEDGEALMARVHLSQLPRADAERVAWVIRRYFSVGCALQEAKRRAQRRRSWLCGKSPKPSPAEASASSPADGGGTSPAAALKAEAAGAAGAPAKQAPPGEPQTPEQAKLQGGPRPGTGCLGAAASAGATRVACRHEALAVGQRCPVCGQGTLSPWPAGVERRLDGHALLSALHSALEKLRGSACGAIVTAG